MPKRVYSDEFKRNAAELVLDHGYLIGQACEAVGTNDRSFRRWILQLKRERNGTTPMNQNPLTLEQKEILELKKRIQKLEREKDILKKATALLMSDSDEL